MEVKLIRSKEGQKSYSELCKYCFNDSVGWTDRMFRGDAKKQSVYGAFEGKALKSGIISRHFNVNLFGKMHAMSGISAVASYPESRNRGYIRSLFKKILNDERNAGRTVSALYPFSFAYYGNFGYGALEDYRHITVRPEDILPFAGTKPLVPYDGSQAMFEDIKSIWNGYYGCFDFGSDRSDHTAEGFNDAADFFKYRAYVAYKGKKPLGAIVYTLNIAGSYQSEIDISTLAWTDAAALPGIMGHLAAHRGQCAAIKGEFHSSVPMHLFTKEPRLPTGIIRSWMARPLNLEKILASKLKEQKDFSPVTFSIEDPVIPEESGTYTVSPGSVKKKANTGEHAVPLSVFSSLLFGGMTPEEAYVSVCPERWILDAADFFKKRRRSYLNERF